MFPSQGCHVRRIHFSKATEPAGDHMGNDVIRLRNTTFGLLFVLKYVAVFNSTVFGLLFFVSLFVFDSLVDLLRPCNIIHRKMILIVGWLLFFAED